MPISGNIPIGKLAKKGVFKIDWAIGTVEYGIIPIQVGKKSTETETYSRGILGCDYMGLGMGNWKGCTVNKLTVGGM